MPLSSVGESMRWGEVYRLSLILLTDPSSQVAAAVRGWIHPMSRDGLALRDLIDSYKRVNFKRPEQYPRPWHVQPKRFGSGTSLTASEFQALKRSISEQN